MDDLKKQTKQNPKTHTPTKTSRFLTTLAKRQLFLHSKLKSDRWLQDTNHHVLAKIDIWFIY